MSLVSQRNLAGGELAPSLYSRVDTIKYQTGLKTCKNFYIQKSGGVANRPGTTFIGEVKDSTKLVRLIPFIFNAEQTYVLEFGDLYMRVILNGAYVVEAAKTITDITQAAEGVVTATAHGFENGDDVYINDLDAGMSELNGVTVIVSDKTTDTFKMKYQDGTYVDTSGFSAYVSAGLASRIYTKTTVWDQYEIHDLQFVQSGDVITIVHPDFFPQDLSRLDHDDWTLADKNLEPLAEIPQNVTFSTSAGTPQFSYRYIITTVAEDTYEESLPGESITTLGGAEPANSTPHLVDWDTVSTAAYYNVYVARSGHVGFIGAATTSSFRNNGITPDFSKTPPVANDYMTPAEAHIKPACVAYSQQRLMFGDNDYQGGVYQPEEIIGSRTGRYSNFTISLPLQADDAIKFRMAGRQVNQIRHILDLNKLLIFTSGGEYAVEGGAGGAVTPTDINLKQYSYNGAAKTPAPVVIDSTALYVQDRGAIVRDLAFDYTVDGYRGNDLTVFSWHLFEGKTIVDWAYQKTPNSVLWVVLDDGTMLSLTYIREHQIWGWTRHDTDGLFEKVTVIPEGSEDSVYFVVKRTIDGRSVRYVERMNSRVVDDPKDMIFMDCALSYDGRNGDSSHTMTITQLGGGWEGESLALTCSVGFFKSSDVGNKIQVYGPTGDLVIFTIDSYQDTQNVFCTANKTIPENMRAVALSEWVRAVDTIRGLRHLAGKDIAVLGDGYVVGSPNNADVTTVTVSDDGVVELDDCYGVIHFGLPYISDIETLTIDTPNGESLIDKKMLVQDVYMQVEKTRGLFAGPRPPTGEDPVENLFEAKIRDEESYDEPVALKTGVIDIKINSDWNNNGRTFIRQIDPLPAHIAGISIGGLMPFRG